MSGNASGVGSWYGKHNSEGEKEQKRPGGSVGVRPMDLQDLKEILGGTNDEIADLNDFSIVNSLSDDEIILLLSRAPFSGTREKIAEHLQRFPDPVLKAFVRDREECVRAAVAANTFAPLRAFEALQKDGSELIRKRLASNAACPAKILEILACDASQWVANQASYNASATAETHINYYKTHKDKEFSFKDQLDRMKHRPELSETALERLAKHSDLMSCSLGDWLIDRAVTGQDCRLLESLSSNRNLTDSVYRRLITELPGPPGDKHDWSRYRAWVISNLLKNDSAPMAVRIDAANLVLDGKCIVQTTYQFGDGSIHKHDPDSGISDRAKEFIASAVWPQEIYLKLAESPPDWLKTSRDKVESEKIPEYLKIVRANGSIPDNIKAQIEARLRPQNSCFPPDALVLTPCGARPIKDLAVGDLVYSNSFSGQLVVRPVTRTFRHKWAPIVRITAGHHELRATQNHRILTRRGWQEIRSLLTSDEIYIGGRLVRVESVTADGYTGLVFNVHTAIEHNFIVNGVNASNFTRLAALQHLFNAVFVDPPRLIVHGMKTIAERCRRIRMAPHRHGVILGHASSPRS